MEVGNFLAEAGPARQVFDEVGAWKCNGRIQ